MPKKFVGENSKAAAARARKASAKETENAKKQKELEDSYWKEEDKLIQKKQQRKEEQERKRQQQLEKKQEAKLLLEKEMSAVNKTTKNQPPSKVTRAQIELVKVAKPAPKKEVIETHLTVPLEENINRLTVEGEEARNVTEAIAILSSTQEDTDKHPEKRLKAAYAAFEERRLKQLKEENSTLRLSQLKQMIFKEWQKSPENPLNKA